MLWQWLVDNFKYRRKWLWFWRGRNRSFLEVRSEYVVTRRQYNALLACMEHLEGNISAYGLFVISRNVAQVMKVFEKIKSGDPHMRQYLQLSQMPHECAIAFRRFLRTWKIQFLPRRCMNVLGGNIANVPPRLVALDVLNLLPEEYSGTRLYFAKRYLRLMRCFILRGCPRPNEMYAATIPILAYMFSFPQRTQHTLATSLTIFELIVLSELVDDTAALAKELRSSCIAFERRASSDGTR